MMALVLVLMPLLLAVDTHNRTTDIECVSYFMRCHFGQSFVFQLLTVEFTSEFIYACFDCLCSENKMSPFLIHFDTSVASYEARMEQKHKGFPFAQIPGTARQPIDFWSFTQRQAENQISAEKLLIPTKKNFN